MIERRNSVLALVVGVAVALGAGAGTFARQDKPRGQTMSMDDMMKNCREHCQATSKSIAQMSSAMNDAKQSNDPSKTRAAIDQAQKPLADMKDHMKMCMDMMSMMQNMHGMGGMMSGGRMGGMMSGQKADAAKTTEKKGLDIAFRSQPDPPKTGQNTFEVTVKGPDGKPITDAVVSVAFYMAAMPSMNMPEMRNSVTLKHDAEGRYRGTGNVAMGGRWDVTVAVKRGGKAIGSRKLTVTAQ